MFWYGGFNAVFKREQEQGPASFRSSSLGTVLSKTRNLNWSAKISYNLTANQNHQIEGSAFGDPSTQPLGPNRVAFSTGGGALDSDFPERLFSALDYGSRSWSVRYNGAITPHWLVNASFGWAFIKFNESGFPNIFAMSDRTEATPGGLNTAGDGLPTPGTSRGINEIGGIGFFENTVGNNKQYTVNGTLNLRGWGSHQLDSGFEYQDVDFSWDHRNSGPNWNLPCSGLSFDGTTVATTFRNGIGAAAPDCNMTMIGGAFRLRNGGPSGFRLQQIRGLFGGFNGTTRTKYYAGYIQDSWQMTKYITLKLGLRWEQQRMSGDTANNQHYAFTGNWAPRAGLIVDPWGNRKTKIFFNFGRFFEKIPQDLAVRSLSQELDYVNFFFAVTNPNSADSRFKSGPGCPIGASLASCLNNPANWIPDTAHHIFPDDGTGSPLQPAFTGGVTNVAAGTKMQYQDEYVVGLEHEFRGGIFVSVRYLDRRLRRIVEDVSGITVGGFNAAAAFDGSPIFQTFLLTNPSASLDLFHNTACHNPAEDVTVEVDGSGCLTSGYAPGSALPGADGVPDGFPNPVRKYQAFEFQFEKRFTKNWQLIGNWRIAKLFGNYEGLFRNDNGQDDPNITSLFDFVRSSSLGDQFTPGVLPTDRRDIVNVYSSYLFNNGINIGGGMRFQTGYPLDKLGAHPAYLNQGEIPLGGRGSQGRTLATAGIDAQVNYTWKMSERYRVKLGVSMFNVVNSRRVQRLDRNADTGFLSGAVPNIQANPDFLKPTAARDAYQRPFDARLSVRLEF
jgi:hypothetical protein